jgi:hypothetical protein
MPRNALNDARSVTLRLTLIDPPTGVSWAVQLGRMELLPPASVTPDTVTFEIPLGLITTSTGEWRLLGAAVQGPRGGRFLYVNSGSRAGAPRSVWDRRAKVPLESIPLDQLAATPAEAPILLQAEIAGTARDGGPACASVQLLHGGWTIVKHTA